MSETEKSSRVCRRGQEWHQKNLRKRPIASDAPVVEELKEKLHKYVSEQKLKRSEIRELILDAIVSGPTHFTAQELVDRVSTKYPSIGQATVYRNLPVFVASRILDEGPLDRDANATYELAGVDHHDHIVCLDCGMILEFKDAAIEKRQDEISRLNSFSPVDHRHVLYGHCLEKK